MQLKLGCFFSKVSLFRQWLQLWVVSPSKKRAVLAQGCQFLRSHPRSWDAPSPGMLQVPGCSRSWDAPSRIFFCVLWACIYPVTHAQHIPDTSHQLQKSDGLTAVAEHPLLSKISFQGTFDILGITWLGRKNVSDPREISLGSSHQQSRMTSLTTADICQGCPTYGPWTACGPG